MKILEMTKKRQIIYLLVIILLAIFLRVFALNTIPPGLYHDEAMNGNNALEALETDTYKWFYSENNGREGLYVNLATIPLAIFGNKTWALRLLSSIFGILTVLGLFLLTKELFKNERVALFASFFIAVSFWHINFSRIGFRGIMAPFFLVWAFYLLYKVINNKKEDWKLSIGYWVLTALSGLMFGLGFHSYIAYRVAPLLLIFPFYRLWKHSSAKTRNTGKKVIFVFLFFTFIAGLPLGLYFLQNPADFLGRTSQVSIFSVDSPVKELAINIAKTIGMFFVWGDGNWRHNLPPNPALWWPMAILFLFGVLPVGKQALNLFKNLDRFLISPSVFLFTWILVMLLPVIISSEGLPHALRAIIVIPPVMIFIGLGFKALGDKVNNWLLKQSAKAPNRKKQILRIRKELIALLFAFLVVVTINSFGKYFFEWGLNLNTYNSFNTRYFEIGKYLNSLPKETEKYVIVNSGGVLVNNIPMPSQTIMFATNSFTQKSQNEKNIKYITYDEVDTIECRSSCVISIMESDQTLSNKILKNISSIKPEIVSGNIIIYKN